MEANVQPYTLASEEGQVFWFLDTLMFVKATGEQTGGALGLIEQVLPAGSETSYHMHHDEDEYWYVEVPLDNCHLTEGARKMNITIDRERNEVEALLEFAGDLKGKRVLEIGAGYGRLTWRYASKAGKIVGIDPDAERIARSKKDMPKELRGHVTMLETPLEEYQRNVRAPLFDVALMSWSL